MQRVINRDGPALPGGNNRSTPILSDRYQDSFPSEAGEIYILGFFSGRLSMGKSSGSEYPGREQS